MTTREPGREQQASGEVQGVRWVLMQHGEQTVLRINERNVHLLRDELGSYTTHAATGRWRDVAELAQLLIRHHPDISPFARMVDPPPLV